MKFSIYTLIYLAIILIVGCAQKDNNLSESSFEPKPESEYAKEERQLKASDDSDKWSYKITIKENLPKYIIKFFGKEAPNFINVTKIAVYKGSNPNPVQILSGFKTLTPIIGNTILFEVDDINFDGFNDLRLVEREELSYLPFIYWTFNPKRGIFERNKSYEKIKSPTFDYADKVITSYHKSGSTTFTTDYYRIENNQPVLYRQEIKSYLKDNKWQTLIKERQDGELVVVDKQISDF